MSGVWIVVTDNNTKQKTVVEAKDYQKDGYYKFMAKMPKLEYNEDGYVFTILPVDGDKDKYRGSCLYINESGDKRILSDNKKALDEYVKNQNAAIIKNAANKEAANKEAAKQNAARQEASLSPAGDVWIADMNGSGPVRKADSNQADAYHKFMSQSGPKQYKVTYDYSGSTIVISPFNGRKGNYPRFCNILVKDTEVYILSDNFEDLEKYNNLTIYQMRRGGNRTKRSRKTKKSKRAHTSKRK